MTAIHLVQAIYFRLWFLLPTVILCGLGELTGWSGRLWSSYNILNGNAYLMQCVCYDLRLCTVLLTVALLRITTTIISPTPYAHVACVVTRVLTLRHNI